MNIKAVLFARVSTREQAQEGYSLPAQEKLLKEYAGNKGFSILKTFSVPESARGNQERKAFCEMVNYLYDKPDAKILICEKVDRLTRNLRDAVDINKWLNEDSERQVHFVKENTTISKDSKSNEKFIWNIKVSVAQYYVDNLSEEVKKGLDEKAREGWYPGSHKRGYKTAGDMGHKTWMIDREKPDARYIEKAFLLYNLGGHTLRTVSNELFKEGWGEGKKPIHLGELHRILTDPFFYGDFIWKGERFQGKHEGLVSKELFESVQEKLRKPIKAGKFIKHNFLFGGGLMICGDCGRTVTWETQKGHAYGHCTRYGGRCEQKGFIREEEVDRQIVQILNGLIIDNPRVLEWVRKALKESHRDEDEYHTSTIQELDSQIVRFEKRLGILYDDRLDGKIEKNFYKAKKEQYEEELRMAVEAKESHLKANINYLELGMNIFELAQQSRELYQSAMSDSEKKELLNFLFSNLKLKNKKVIPTFKNGFQIVAKHAETGNWQGREESNLCHGFWRPRAYH